MSRPGRKLAAAFAGLVVAGAIYAWAGGGGRERWIAVEPRELVFGIPFEGQLVALENLELGPPAEIDSELWQFKLSFLATDGKQVAAGEPVMGFDPSELVKQLDTATAQRDEADKTLEKRSIEIEILRRQRRLQLAEAEARSRKSELELAVPAELLSRSELETARIDRRLAEDEIDFRRRGLAALDRAEEVEMANLREQSKLAAAKVERGRKGVQAMTVVAPRAGTVIVRSRNNNDEKYKVGDNIWRLEKVIQIPELASLRAKVEIDEALGGRLAVGQRAGYFLDAHPDRALAGRVELINQSVQRKSVFDPTKILKVTLTVEKGEAAAAVALRPGMRLRGQIEMERRSAVLAIPEEAVLLDDQGIYVEARGLAGTSRLRPQLGRRSQGYFEVLAGLERGQQLRLPAPVAGGAP